MSYCWGSPRDKIGPFSRHGECETPLYKYVDDCAVTETIRTCHLKSSNLKCEIDNVNYWSIDNNLKLNVIKSKKFNVSMSHAPHLLPSLAIGDDETLEVVHTVKHRPRRAFVCRFEVVNTH